MEERKVKAFISSKKINKVKKEQIRNGDHERLVLTIYVPAICLYAEGYTFWTTCTYIKQVSTPNDEQLLDV